MSNDEVIHFGGLKLNVPARKFYVRRNLIVLTNKEFTLLEFFMRNVGIVLSRTRLLEEVWDTNICCATNTIDVHVSTLRKKIMIYLGQSPIKTIHSIGYIFEV